MNDINQIDINVNGIDRPIDITINPKELKAYIPSGEKKIDESIITKLLSIVCLWNNEYKKNIIDGPIYLVKITTSKEVVEYKGMGDYPYNFKEFLDLIGKIYG